MKWAEVRHSLSRCPKGQSVIERRPTSSAVLFKRKDDRDYAMRYFYFVALIVVGCSTGPNQPTMFMTMQSEETVPLIMTVETSPQQ